MCTVNLLIKSSVAYGCTNCEFPQTQTITTLKLVTGCGREILNETLLI